MILEFLAQVKTNALAILTWIHSNIGVVFIVLCLFLILYIRYIGPAFFWTKVAAYFKLKVVAKGKVIKDYSDENNVKKYYEAINKQIDKEFNPELEILKENIYEEQIMEENYTELEVLSVEQNERTVFTDIIEYRTWLNNLMDKDCLCFAYYPDNDEFLDVGMVREETQDYFKVRESFFTTVLAKEFDDLNVVQHDMLTFKLSRDILQHEEASKIANEYAMTDLNGDFANVVMYNLFLHFDEESNTYRLERLMRIEG